jgi:uncharacterized protein YggE
MAGPSAAAIDATVRDTITVTGVGTAEAVPDVVVATFGSELSAGTVSEALDGAVRAMAEVIAQLQAGGVGELDLNTGAASIWSVADEHGRVAGYVATQRLTARLRSVATAGALVGEAIAAGGDAARLHGLSFALTDVQAVNEWARVQAWRDARARAGQLATLAGRVLGPVVRIKEGPAAQPMPQAFAATRTRQLAHLPLEPGTETVTVAIEVEWAFLD